MPRPPDYFTPRSLLAPRAEELTVAGTSVAVLVAALADIHKSKRAADRPKDRAYFLAVGEPGLE